MKQLVALRSTSGSRRGSGEEPLTRRANAGRSGESETIQLKDLIAAIEEGLGRKATINLLPEQPGDVPLTCADIAKARRLLGYQPTTPLRIGLPRFIEWFHQTRDRA